MTHRTSAIACLTVLAGFALASAQEPSKQPAGPIQVFEKAGVAKTPLWPEAAPLAAGTDPQDQPGLFVLLPEPAKANGTACVICPGGGYGFLAFDHEGIQPARWLNQQGIAAFVLQYRLAPRYKQPCPQLDVQRALRYVRANHERFRVDPKRVGVWGFSAGGHLASTAGVRFDSGDPAAKDPVDRLSCRPDFLILAYPVISFESPVAHRGSRNNLLGTKADDAKLDAEFSTHLQVKPDTPTTFLFHTNEDSAVPPENSILFYQALRRQKIPAELHVYAKGKHGVGLAPNDPVLAQWPAPLAAWLRNLPAPK